MKNILLIATMLVSLISCSRSSGTDVSNSDDRLNANAQKSKIAPPSWLYGMWVGKNNFIAGGYEVKHNDLLLVVSIINTDKFSYAGALREGVYRIEEQKATNNEYYLYLVSDDGVSSSHIKYRFVKKGNKVILYQDGDNEYGEELIKK